MFVDATFGIVPKQFSQCLIIMVFDAARRIYVPCAWVLMSGKTNECYWQVFNWLTSVVQELSPSYIGVDFERAFFSNAALHFPGAKMVGCNFHFKQAGRRNMKKRGIPDDEVSFAMRFGVYDLLPVIPVDHLYKGIDFLFEMIVEYLKKLYPSDKKQQAESEKRWSSFFAEYFM